MGNPMTPGISGARPGERCPKCGNQLFQGQFICPSCFEQEKWAEAEHDAKARAAEAERKRAAESDLGNRQEQVRRQRTQLQSAANTKTVSTDQSGQANWSWLFALVGMFFAYIFTAGRLELEPNHCFIASLVVAVVAGAFWKPILKVVLFVVFAYCALAIAAAMLQDEAPSGEYQGRKPTDLDTMERRIELPSNGLPPPPLTTS
jgi:hypothetical protein